MKNSQEIVDIVFIVFGLLHSLGVWLLSNVFIAMGIVILVAISFFILRKMVGLFKAVLLVGLVSVCIYFAYTFVSPHGFFDIGGTIVQLKEKPTSTNAFEIVKVHNPALWKQLELQKQIEYSNTQALQNIVSVKYEDISAAPNITNLSFDEGIEELRQIAAEFSGEVAYYYVELKSDSLFKPGKKFWYPMGYSDGYFIEVVFENLELLLSTHNNIRRITLVHTHPTLASNKNYYNIDK